MKTTLPNDRGQDAQSPGLYINYILYAHLIALVAIGINSICECKTNRHAIVATTIIQT